MRNLRSLGPAAVIAIAVAATIGAAAGPAGAAPSLGNVRTWRLARVNITVPDDLLGQARAAGLNVSQLAAAALTEELDRRAKIAQLDACLTGLGTERGPIQPQEWEAARAWADATLPPVLR